MTHIVLLGDSIFDNAVYVPGGPSVLEHLLRMLPDGWQATLLAVDGATVSSTHAQLGRIPHDATHLVLSAGGNDALLTGGDLFHAEAADVREALEKIGSVSDEFASEYKHLVNELRSKHLPLTLCTVYDSIPGLTPAELAGLCVFNDTITRTAFETGATLIDLRTVCREAADYSSISPIEPSASGGRKIASAIASAVDDDGGQCRVIASG